MNEIRETIENYISGYLNADADLILSVFDTNVRLLSVDETKLDSTAMADWVQNIRQRKEKGDIRSGTTEIVNIDITQDAASAKVVIVLPKIKFTDYLSLLKFKDQWKIVAKVYTVEARTFP